MNHVRRLPLDTERATPPLVLRPTDSLPSLSYSTCRSSFFSKKSSNTGGGSDYIDRDDDREYDGGASRQAHVPTRPVDRDKAEQELSLNIKKATSPEESAPKQKHVRSRFYSTLWPARAGLVVELGGAVRGSLVVD